MTAGSSASLQVFEESLHRALAHGQRPPRDGLHPDTRAAIEAVALQHPDATPDQIATAYDAYRRETDWYACQTTTSDVRQ